LFVNEYSLSARLWACAWEAVERAGERIGVGKVIGKAEKIRKSMGKILNYFGDDNLNYR
jgi:hypothetical protein